MVGRAMADFVNTVTVAEVELTQLSAVNEQLESPVNGGTGHVLVIPAKLKQQILGLELLVLLKDRPGNLLTLRG